MYSILDQTLGWIHISYVNFQIAFGNIQAY